MRVKKVFVTGAMGFIGFHWCKKLLENGYEVYAIDIKKNNQKLNHHKKFRYYRDSVFNYDLVRKLIKNNFQYLLKFLTFYKNINNLFAFIFFLILQYAN